MAGSLRKTMTILFELHIEQGSYWTQKSHNKNRPINFTVC